MSPDGQLSPPLLDVVDVGLVAGGAAILDSIGLSLEAGRKLAVVGPNGAGKSSLLALISGAVRPTRGTVRLQGRDLARIGLAERARHIALVGQNDVPDGRLRVADYVALGRIPHRGATSAVRDAGVVGEAMERVGVVALARRTLETLSGGERQRAAVARAVAQEPALLLLDEPTNHLDPRARADMLDLVAGLGIAVVAVLHDLALVAPFADSVLVMARGRVVAHDAPVRALAPPIVREVFAMDCFPVVNPASGRTLLVFDTPPKGSP